MSVIGRPIVDHEPLEIAKCLHLQALEWAMQGVRTVMRWGEYREHHLAGCAHLIIEGRN